MTASLILPGLGLKLRRRWNSEIFWDLEVGEEEVAVMALGVRI